MICAFSVPAFATHPWVDEPGDHKTDGPSKSPYSSGLEPGETLGHAAADKTTTVNSPRSDLLSAAMYELTYYMYDLLAGNDQDGLSAAPEPKSRK